MNEDGAEFSAILIGTLTSKAGSEMPLTACSSWGLADCSAAGSLCIEGSSWNCSEAVQLQFSLCLSGLTSKDGSEMPLTGPSSWGLGDCSTGSSLCVEGRGRHRSEALRLHGPELEDSVGAPAER